jgi:glutathione S-transferase
MKLYFSPGTCSLSPHIVLREAELPFTPVKVNLSTHTLSDGSNYYDIEPKGYVPMLELDNGQRLTEGQVIVQYLADQVPHKQLIPAAGSQERYRAQEWLAFIATEIHKGFSPLFSAQLGDEAKSFFRTRLLTKLEWVNRELEAKEYLMGNAFCVADAYLFTVVSWAGFMKLDLTPFTHLQAYMARVSQRPAVQQALEAEGLKK